MEPQIQNRIMHTLQHFDSFRLAEVLDFVEYLDNKNGRDKKDWTHIDSLFGKYKDKLSPSDVFARSKKTEKEKEERKWKRNKKVM